MLRYDIVERIRKTLNVYAGDDSAGDRLLLNPLALLQEIEMNLHILIRKEEEAKVILKEMRNGG